MKDKNLILIVSVFVVLLSLGIIFFLVIPAYKALETNKVQLAEDKLNLQYRRDYVKEIKKDREEMQKDEKSVSKVNFALPQDVSFASLFNFLQFEAQMDGLTLKQVNVPVEIPLVLQKEVTGKRGRRRSIIRQRTNLDYYPFKASVKGPYESFKNFVLHLQNSARMIEINNINFYVPAGFGTSSVLTYNLNLRVYSFHK